MLQNARVTAFAFSELLRENQQGGGGGIRMDGKSKNDVFIKLRRNFGEMKFSRNWKKVYVR